MAPGMFPVLTAKELAAAGQALYGANWRMELARVFGLEDEALLRAVEAGRMEAPPDWRAHLIALAQDQAVRAMAVANALLHTRPQNRSQSLQGAPPRMV